MGSIKGQVHHVTCDAPPSVGGIDTNADDLQLTVCNSGFHL